MQSVNPKANFFLQDKKCFLLDPLDISSDMVTPTLFIFEEESSPQIVTASAKPTSKRSARSIQIHKNLELILFHNFHAKESIGQQSCLFVIKEF